MKTYTLKMVSILSPLCFFPFALAIYWWRWPQFVQVPTSSPTGFARRAATDACCEIRDSQGMYNSKTVAIWYKV